LAESMGYERLQHVHLRTARACTRREALYYLLLSDSSEQVSYISETANQGQSLPYELAHSDFIFCSRVQPLRDEWNIQEVLMYSTSSSQHYPSKIFGLLEPGASALEEQCFTTLGTSRIGEKAQEHRPG